MTQIHIVNGKACKIVTGEQRRILNIPHDQIESGWDWQGKQSLAEQRAKELTAFLGELYLCTDAGSGVSPRFDVMRAPQVGDEISYGFNGDYYPDGEIASISATMKKITSTTGNVYYGDAAKGRWTKKGGTFSMVHGHHDEQNPHF